MQKLSGFTLIELMIAITIVSILAALAIPSYRSYIERSYLSEAFSSLSSYQLSMQQFYQDSGNYGAANCGVATPDTKHFSYACVLANGGFTITASSRAVDGLTAAEYVFTIDANNNQATTVFPDLAVAQSCWITNAGATCS